MARVIQAEFLLELLEYPYSGIQNAYFNRNSGKDYVDNHMCSQRVVKRVVQNLRESILTNIYNVLAYLDWTQERQDRFSPDDILFRAVCQRNEELLVNKGFE